MRRLTSMLVAVVALSAIAAPAYGQFGNLRRKAKDKATQAVTGQNAAQLNCRVLAEGANGPTTLEADRIVQDKGIFVIPDILANSGGVIVSYFEWVQDAQRFFWKATDIQERLRDLMTSAFQRTLHFATAKRTSMRMAALMTGIDKVAQAHLNRGLYP